MRSSPTVTTCALVALLTPALALLPACHGSEEAQNDGEAGRNSEAGRNNEATGEENGGGGGSGGGDEEDCGDCRDEKCVDLVRYCAQDADCQCLSDCIDDKGIPGVETCRGTCALADLPPAFALLEDCVAMSCPDEDECSTPKDYASPEVEYADAGVSDASMGAGDLPDCSFDPELRFDPNGEILQLESEDKGVCVRLDRRNDGAGNTENTQFTLIDLLVGPPGEVAHIEDPSALCYYSSHHNFKDWAHAWTGTRHFDLMIEADGWGGWRTYELYASEQGPLDDSAPCEPLADGVGRIGDPIILMPVIP